MKKFLLVILLLATVGFGIWFYYFKNKETSDLPIQLPGNPFSTPSTPVQPHNPLGSDFKNDPEVLRDFKNQIINSNLIILDGTKISNEYALQLWHDENKGGEALLKYDTKQGWVLLSMGGGSWSAEDLLTAGVPYQTAKVLISGSVK